MKEQNHAFRYGGSRRPRRRKFAEADMRIVVQLSFLIMLGAYCSGCASLALIDKTGPTTESARGIISARKSADDVFLKYRTEVLTATSEIVSGPEKVAVFRLPHVSGKRVVAGQQVESLTIPTNTTVKVVQVVSSTNTPSDVLLSDGMVVWGNNVNGSLIVEQLNDGQIGTIECRMEDVIHKRGWWALPTRIILFPVAVVLDVASVPLIIVISPFYMAGLMAGGCD